jgi:hypothetical protein
MPKVSIDEQQQAVARRAMSVPEFCRRYGPGKTSAYQEIQAGKLRARKVGRRTIITQDDAEDWLRRLPSAVSAVETCEMTIKKSSGAVDAARGAFETDELGWRVFPKNSLFPQLAQAPQHGGESMRSCDRHEPTSPKQQEWLRDIRVRLGSGASA